MNQILRILAVGLSILLLGTSVLANERITIIVPSGAGGNVDLPARHFADFLRKKWNIPVIVDNKPGASGVVAADAAAKSPADGSVVFLTPSQHVTLPAMMPKLPFDHAKGLIPVATVAAADFVVMVPGSSPIKDIYDLRDRLKAKPGTVTNAVFGTAGASALGWGLLESQTGLNSMEVPMKTNGEISTSILGGHVDFAFQPLILAVPFLADKKVRVLAVSGTSRLERVPETPTLDESIAKGYSYSTWLMFMMPGGTPEKKQEMFNEAVKEYLKHPETLQFLKRIEGRPIPMSLTQTRQYYKSELERLMPLAKKIVEKASKSIR